MPENKKNKLNRNYDHIVTERLKSRRLKHDRELKAKRESTAPYLVYIQKHIEGFTARWKERLYIIITLLLGKLTNSFFFYKKDFCFLGPFPSHLSKEDLAFLRVLHEIKNPESRKQLLSLIKIILAEEKKRPNSILNKMLDSYLKNSNKNKL
jgi:hypothetical protein